MLNVPFLFLLDVWDSYNSRITGICKKFCSWITKSKFARRAGGWTNWRSLSNLQSFKMGKDSKSVTCPTFLNRCKNFEKHIEKQNYAFLGQFKRIAKLQEKFDSDWLFLLSLGIIVALISFGLDFSIDKCQQGSCIQVFQFKTPSFIVIKFQKIVAKFKSLQAYRGAGRLIIGRGDSYIDTHRLWKWLILSII